MRDWKRAEDIEEIRDAFFAQVPKPVMPDKKKSYFNYGISILVLALVLAV
jgi:hypothetical protein